MTPTLLVSLVTAGASVPLTMPACPPAWLSSDGLRQLVAADTASRSLTLIDLEVPDCEGAPDVVRVRTQQVRGPSAKRTVDLRDTPRPARARALALVIGDMVAAPMNPRTLPRIRRAEVELAVGGATSLAAPLLSGRIGLSSRVRDWRFGADLGVDYSPRRPNKGELNTTLFWVGGHILYELLHGSLSLELGPMASVGAAWIAAHPDERSRASVEVGQGGPFDQTVKSPLAVAGLRTRLTMGWWGIRPALSVDVGGVLSGFEARVAEDLSSAVSGFYARALLGVRLPL